MNKPFLKWAGNKYKILSHILPLIGECHQYIEPFAGSMSVALNISSKNYVLNDINEDLIELYKMIVHDDNFIHECEKLFQNSNDETVYYDYRNRYNQTENIQEKSALFIYLNRHCFNGLVRYNKKKEFNVPFGKYKSPYFPKVEMENFRNFIRNCNSVQFTSYDFENELLYQNVNENTYVYFDPPYVPLSATSNFTAYSCDGFNDDDQIRLRDLALELLSKDATIIISNHDVERARELYESATKIISIDVNRSISANKDSRGKVKELIAIYSNK